jgi:phospholipid/cholesterol/gamma-HCH transport system substrate-binding protein
VSSGGAFSLPQRVTAIATLLVAVLVVVYLVVLSPGASYTVHARFADAGQLVKGDLVEVGGRKVGTITRIGLTADGQADLTLAIDEPDLVPVHEGTTATIRQVGLVTITNRYIALEPGPSSTPSLPDGGVISEQYTRGIVDPDVLLDAFDPATRRNLVAVFRESAGALAPPTAGQLNRAVAFLDPAFVQTADLAQEATLDRPALGALVSNLASVSGALAAQPATLTGSVHSTAATMEELAAQRAAVGELLDRAAGVLGHADHTLAAARTTLAKLDPLLADLRPVAPPAARLLAQVVPVLDNTVPTLAEVRALIAQATPVLSALPSATRRAVPAIGAATQAFASVLSMLAGLRVYAPDLVAGFFNGFGGSNAGYYDANGHYARIAVEFGPGGGTGVLSSVPPTQPSSFNSYRTRRTARCPGGASGAAAAGANPWPVPGLCNPAQDQP